ncbi:MAG: ATP12 family protein, partial [Alphaproteobacteria bacterium]
MPKAPPSHTPAKRRFEVHGTALNQAIRKEWETFETFSPSAMPMTSLAFTAIDQVEGNRDNMIEVLLAYVDTDTLCYRSEKSEMLGEQKKQWDPLLAWAGDRYSALWQTTTGIMPLEQSAVLHEAIREHLATLDSMRLTACGMLASGYSSLVLALAVLDKKLSAIEALRLSLLEEDLQAKQWGIVEEADEKKQQMQEEIMVTSRF